MIEELIAWAKEMREAERRGKLLGLREELAFCDALETNLPASCLTGREASRNATCLRADTPARADRHGQPQQATAR